jgi:hypothetical protein
MITGLPSPDSSGNPFLNCHTELVEVLQFKKDYNRLLRQFALSGSGAGITPNYIKEMRNRRNC